MRSPARLCDLDRLQHALPVGEPAEEQHVVVGLGPERERFGVDAVQHRSDDVEAREQPGLLVGDRDERRLRDSATTACTSSGLGEWCSVWSERHRAEPGEPKRQRVVRRLEVNDVELRRALDRRRQVEHLVELPRPHRRVVPVAAWIGGCESRGGRGVAGREQRDVVAALHEPFGQQPRNELDGSGAGRRKRRGDGGDLGDAEWLHTRVLDAASRARESPRSAPARSRRARPAWWA